MEVTKEQIKETILSHVTTVNSFIDSDGNNMFMPCVNAIYRLCNTTDNDSNMAFGKKLKRRRVIAEMSQQELADLVQVSKSFISLVESGKRSIDGQTAQRWMTAVALWDANV